jgi:predicted SnoaL-like aldol condensation-catalyzing enzyme
MRRSTHLAAAAALALTACDTATVDTTYTGSKNAPVVASLAPPPAPVVEGRPVNVVGHPDPLSLLESDDPVLAANKRLVFDMWRGIVNGGHVELADELLAEGYIQHSPVLPTGRAAFKKIFSVVERRDEIPEVVEPPLGAIIAEGDLVAMTLVEELPEPSGSGTYTTTHFNMFRIEDGRLAEHWHSVQSPPGPDLPSPEGGGSQLVTGSVGAEQLALLEASDPELANNKRLVFDVSRQILDARREEIADLYFAEDYIQHNPNAATGREGFKAYFSTREDLPIEASIRAPLVAMVAEGDLVVQAIRLEHPHPSREGAIYTTTWFDMFRVADGRLAEHWDPAAKPMPPAANAPAP